MNIVLDKKVIDDLLSKKLNEHIIRKQLSDYVLVQHQLQSKKGGQVEAVVIKGDSPCAVAEGYEDTIKFLSSTVMEYHDLHLRVCSLEPAEAKEKMIMEFPIVQGMIAQNALRKIGRQKIINEENIAVTLNGLATASL